MSITYCCIFATKEKILLAESSSSESQWPRIKGLFASIYKKKVLDIIEIEGDVLLTFLRTKKIVFISTSSSKQGEERPRRFIEQFAQYLIKEFGHIDNILPTTEFKKFALQNRVQPILNKLIEDFDTGIYKSKDLINTMNKDLNDIKVNLNTSIKQIVNNKGELDEMLLTSKKISNVANEYKDNAKELEYETRCIKPWMIIMIIVILVIFIVYTIFAIYLCGSLTLFCDGKKYYSTNSNNINVN